MSIRIFFNSGTLTFSIFPFGSLGHLQPLLYNWSTTYVSFFLFQWAFDLLLSQSVSCLGFSCLVFSFFNIWDLISWLFCLMVFLLALLAHVPILGYLCFHWLFLHHLGMVVLVLISSAMASSAMASYAMGRF